jgi:hypothetical protein
MTNRSMKNRRDKGLPMQGPPPAITLGHARDARVVRDLRGDARGESLPPPGFSSVMSRVCELVWPVWLDTASSERDGDLAGSERTTMVAGACGTSVSRHSVLQRTPVGPVDQRRAVYAPI